MKPTKLKSIAIFIGIAMTTAVIAQTTTNYVAKFGATPPAVINSIIQDNGTNVGIGSAGSYKLDVNGDINIQSSGIFRWSGTSFIVNTGGVGLGNNALSARTSGTQNTCIGTNSGGAISNSSNCTYVGFYAGTLANAGNNTCIGSYANANNTAGSDNTTLGYQSGYNNTASYNIFIGSNSGTTNTTGSSNTLVGYSSDVSSSGLSNATAIGANAKVYSSNTIELGDNSTAVSIGYSGSALTSQTKFDVLFNTGSAFSAGPVYNGHFINSNTISGTTTPYVYGVYAAANGSESSNSTYHYGVSASATNANYCVAISGVSVANTNGGKAYGGYFNASSGSVNYGMYATAPSSSNNTLPNWAGYFNNDVYINGNGWINAAWNISDQKYKTDINAINNPLDIIKKLTPKSYQYITDNPDGLSFPSEKQYGFIAQDVQKVLPELVRSVSKPEEVDANGKVIHASVKHLGVNYNAFFALTIAAMQQQQNKVDSLTALTTKQDSINKALQNQINQIVNNAVNNSTNDRTVINSQNIELSSTVVLNQNVPNPFAEQTVITYNVPQNFTSAQILFYDSNGKLIKIVDVKTTGKGQLNVFANDLTSGIYSYSLIIDGKIIDTKKMMKQD